MKKTHTLSIQKRNAKKSTSMAKKYIRQHDIRYLVCKELYSAISKVGTVPKKAWFTKHWFSKANKHCCMTLLHASETLAPHSLWCIKDVIHKAFYRQHHLQILIAKPRGPDTSRLLYIYKQNKSILQCLVTYAGYHEITDSVVKISAYQYAVRLGISMGWDPSHPMLESVRKELIKTSCRDVEVIYPIIDAFNATMMEDKQRTYALQYALYAAYAVYFLLKMAKTKEADIQRNKAFLKQRFLQRITK